MPFSFRPSSEAGDLERCAPHRAELDAYHARLYGLARDELRYILDPADVMGADYPSETSGEYCTRWLVLEAWNRMDQIQ